MALEVAPPLDSCPPSGTRRAGNDADWRLLNERLVLLDIQREIQAAKCSELTELVGKALMPSRHATSRHSNIKPRTRQDAAQSSTQRPARCAPSPAPSTAFLLPPPLTTWQTERPAKVGAQRRGPVEYEEHGQALVTAWPLNLECPTASLPSPPSKASTPRSSSSKGRRSMARQRKSACSSVAALDSGAAVYYGIQPGTLMEHQGNVRPDSRVSGKPTFASGKVHSKSVSSQVCDPLANSWPMPRVAPRRSTWGHKSATNTFCTQEGDASRRDNTTRNVTAAGKFVPHFQSLKEQNVIGAEPLWCHHFEDVKGYRDSPRSEGMWEGPHNCQPERLEAIHIKIYSTMSGSEAGETSEESDVAEFLLGSNGNPSPQARYCKGRLPLLEQQKCF